MTTKPKTAPAPATNETSLLRDQITRLEHLHASPPLVLAVRGGGLGEEKVISPVHALLIERDELFCVLNRLRDALAFREAKGW